MENKDIPNGALLDSRTSEEKNLDYTHVEVLGGTAFAPTWKERTEWKVLSIRGQANSTSCGAQSFAKAVESFTGVVASALPSFESRSNYPSPGMYLQDVCSIAVKTGTDEESKLPSQNMNDPQLDSHKLEYTGMPFKVSSYYTLPAGQDIGMDNLATALSAGHALIIGLSSNTDEWKDIPAVLSEPLTFSHYICCHSGNFTLHNGEKALIIDDSCNLSTTYNQTGQRILTESFLKTRSWGISALIPETTHFFSLPHYNISQDLSYGMMHSPDVVNLQDLLKINGCMDRNIPSSGNFLQITKKAVMAFQMKYKDDILTPLGLTEATGYAGESTRDKLKKLYP